MKSKNAVLKKKKRWNTAFCMRDQRAKKNSRGKEKEISVSDKRNLKGALLLLLPTGKSRTCTWFYDIICSLHFTEPFEQPWEPKRRLLPRRDPNFQERNSWLRVEKKSFCSEQRKRVMLLRTDGNFFPLSLKSGLIVTQFLSLKIHPPWIFS